MALKAYSDYRIHVTSSSAAPNNYVSINEIALYEQADHSGSNILVGSTVTASGSYNSSTLPSNAIDGNPTTYWESQAGLPAWIRFKLQSQKTVRSVYISSTAYPNEVPRNFTLQATNDNGTTWKTLYTWVDWVTQPGAKSDYTNISVALIGVSLLDNGLPTSRVVFHKWDSMQLMGSVVPDNDGSYEYRPSVTGDVLITHTGPSGFRPLSDGPVTPQPS